MKLTDITPVKHKCGTVGTMCPTVLQTDAGTYIIIGKRLDMSTEISLSDRIGLDEAAVEIPAEILESALEGLIQQRAAFTEKQIEMIAAIQTGKETEKPGIPIGPGFDE